MEQHGSTGDTNPLPLVERRESALPPRELGHSRSPVHLPTRRAFSFCRAEGRFVDTGEAVASKYRDATQSQLQRWVVSLSGCVPGDNRGETASHLRRITTPSPPTCRPSWIAKKWPSVPVGRSA